jgi:hypothetical protein
MKKEKKEFKALCGGASVFFIVFTLVSEVAAQDVMPPTVTSAVATPPTADITLSSQAVTLTVTATDDLSGIRVPGADTRTILRSPSNQVVQCGFVLASGTQLDATMEASCVIPRFAETGNWQVDTIISDNAGNIARNSFTGLLTVTGTSDLAAPTVSSAVAAPPAVDITLSSQAVTLTITATDNLSGIRVPGADTRAVLRSPSNQVVLCNFVLASGTQLEATLEASCLIPQSAETGNWQVDTIISDNAGNIARNSFTGLLTVTGNSDLTPPTVTSAVAEPHTINVAPSGQFVTLTVTATDNLSGIRVPGADTRAILRSPSNQVVQCGFVLASGTQLSGVLQASCFVPRFAETGNWQVDTIISDNAGNIARNSFTGLLTVVGPRRRR